MRKINLFAYLRHCLDILRGNSAVMFIYEHSTDENDAHIYRAIFGSETKHIYFGVFKPDGDKLRALDTSCKVSEDRRIDIGYTFFDSGSAKVWET